MTNSPFLDDFLARAPRNLAAPTLALELREAIARWFSARDTMQSSELILAALADLLAEQVDANPDAETGLAALGQFHHEYVRSLRAIRIRRLGGIPVTIVKQ